MKLYLHTFIALTLLSGLVSILLIGCGDAQGPEDMGDSAVEFPIGAAPELLRGDPSPPEQPSSGPGGSDYRYFGVRSNVYSMTGKQYWIFEPVSLVLKPLPLIVFNHGWLGIDPELYMGWIEHIVRKGNIVVYPRYQFGGTTPPRQTTFNAISATKDAIARLQDGVHVRPQLDRFAIVGHSEGGLITANMAALAAEAGLPKPSAIMIVQPGRFDLFTEKLGNIPADTLMLILVGSDDHVVGRRPAERIFHNVPQIPSANKDFITVVTDSYGGPDLVADHLSPLACPKRPRGVSRVDALDYYAYWKLFEALTDCAFYGENREYALGNTPEQRYMGLWSDGAPVKELVITDQP